MVVLERGISWIDGASTVKFTPTTAAWWQLQFTDDVLKDERSYISHSPSVDSIAIYYYSVILSVLSCWKWNNCAKQHGQPGRGRWRDPVALSDGAVTMRKKGTSRVLCSEMIAIISDRWMYCIKMLKRMQEVFCDNGRRGRDTRQKQATVVQLGWKWLCLLARYQHQQSTRDACR